MDLVYYGASCSIFLGYKLIKGYRLAATLGPKSSFKKLPKRSVITADISQLCRLIVNPPEPLALRLSSNLMIGVARYVTIDESGTHPYSPFGGTRSLPAYIEVRFARLPGFCC